MTQRGIRPIWFLFTGMVLGAVLSVSAVVSAKGEGAAAEPLEIPLEELRTFTDVFARIKNDYVEEVDDTTLLENAIRGMLAGLDPHSAYLTPEEFKELKIGTRGEFGGLGIEVGMENGFIKVVTPIDDTPAQRAGIQAGDLIIRLDDKPVKGMSLDEAVKMMRGKPGTSITLTIVREGKDAPIKVTIVRDIIEVKSVKSRMLDDGYGYVRISTFQSRTAADLRKAIGRLKEENGGPLYGLVLDLRNNPGGVLDAAVGVSDAFLSKGLIVYTEGRVADSRLRYDAKPGDYLDGRPMVVLVNEGSASASEIVAGALQDHKRAIIMGKRTFGKGSVQTIMSARGGAAVKLTTARYYTPNGRSIQAEGIAPDIEVADFKVSEAKAGHFERIKEKDLSRHLENDKGAGKPQKSDQELAAERSRKVRELAQSDYPLFEALNLLKGLHVARQMN